MGAVRALVIVEVDPSTDPSPGIAPAGEGVQIGKRSYTTSGDTTDVGGLLIEEFCVRDNLMVAEGASRSRLRLIHDPTLLYWSIRIYYSFDVTQSL